MAALRSVAIAATLACAAPANSAPLDLWSADIAEASARFGVPTAWIRRVMRAESGGQAMQAGRPIVSRAGAMGLMQLMPGTWRDMHVALGLGDDPFDPHDNILAGAFYLRLMYDRFGYPGLFAAYNAGPARYAASLSGARPLPAETRAYVAQVAGVRRAAPLASIRGAMRTAPKLFAVAPANGRADPTAALIPYTGSLFIKLSASGG